MADGSVTFSIDADDREAQKKLNQLRRDIEKTEQSIQKAGDKRSGIVEALQTARDEAEQTAQKISEINKEMSENQQFLSGVKGDIDADEFAARSQAQKELTYELSVQQKLYDKQTATVSKLEGQEQTVTAEINRQTELLGQQTAEAGETEQILATQSSSTLPQLREAIDGVNRSVKKGFKNILKWGFGIRSTFILIRRLRSAIKEGINTFAEYDDETKQNINSLKNSLAVLRASWGAAFAPIINTVTPLLQKLIGYLIDAANYVQMFFSVLGGGNSYKKIIANNDALAESYGNAGGAAKDAQKQLMGFDEINKLDDKSGGGGGGGKSSAIQGTKEELIPPDTMEKLTWVKEHLKEIGEAAGAVGIAVAAWKIGKAFAGGLKTVLGLAMAIYGAFKFVKEYIDAWQNGINFENLTGMLEGLILLVVGLGLAFGTTAAAVGLLVGGIALVVLGIKEWLETGELTSEAFKTIEFGLAAIGIALTLLTGSWIPAVIAAVVMIALAVYKNWDEILAFLKKLWGKIKETAIVIFSPLIQFFAEAWANIKYTATTIWNSIIGVFKTVWNSIKTIFNGIISFVTGNFTGNWKKAWDGIVQIFTGLWDGITGTMKSVLNVGISILEGFINFVIQGVNWILASVSSVVSAVANVLGLGNVNIQLGYVRLPRLAKGGIVDEATPFIAGEDGKEAVIPLERNTEWIHMVSQGIIDGITGNRKFADYISDAVAPAVANGQIVPPRALSGGGSVFTDGDIQKLVNGISAALSGDGGEQVIKLYLDGREIAETVTKHQKRMERSFA